MRSKQRGFDEIRPIKIVRNYTKHAEGSVLIEYGDTKVLCNVSIANGVPKFLKDSGQGWLTAEYGMLPQATHSRTDREAARGRQQGRTMEIQRLIGRSLRSVVNLKSIGENTLMVDCDVIQADGGTRTAAITGSCVAVVDAINHLMEKNKLSTKPYKQLVAAVSVGIFQGKPMLDLDYYEDSAADSDMNVVMAEDGTFIEVQGTAERKNFDRKELDQLLGLAETGIKNIFAIQRQVLEK